MQMQRLGQVWGLGELKCKCNKSPNMSLDPTLEQLKPYQMGSNPNANLNHHMKCHDQAPCEITRSTDKARLHDIFMELHVGCYMLQSLSPSYKGFVLNYNMQGMTKTPSELFAMMKSAEVEIKKEHAVFMVNKTTNSKKSSRR